MHLSSSTNQGKDSLWIVFNQPNHNTHRMQPFKKAIRYEMTTADYLLLKVSC